ncbi:MAG: AraC-like DNA-binding protein [Halocynthiibacter sp.]|jgi:AraC-like DNA-binding protein
MEVVFDTAAIAPAKRASAWREALCGNYVTVDVAIDDPDYYTGQIKQTTFGEINLSQTSGAPQRVTRNKRQISHVEKDCYYLQILNRGTIGVIQRNQELCTNAAVTGLYYASEPYALDCIGVTDASFLEIPRDALATAFDGADLPLTTAISSGTGAGRLLVDFCRVLRAESHRMDAATRASLGDQLLALTALATKTSEICTHSEQTSLRAARLNLIKRYIENNLGDPLLTLARIARDNEISLRYLHRLFEEEDISASDWMWQRRLDRAYSDLLSANQNIQITQIAFANGFNSSSHFSSLFKARFGVTPSDILAQHT